MQIWPWCRNEPQAARPTALSTSTSSSTIIAELPPSSRCTRFRCRPASSPTRRPAAVEPVNEIDADQRVGDQRLADVGAAGERRCSTPAGRPASSKMRASDDAAARPAVRGSGLRTTALPSASAGATARMPRMSGTLNGEITPTTPTGTRCAMRQPRLLAGEQLAVGPGRERGGLVALLGGDVRRRSRPAAGSRRPRACSSPAISSACCSRTGPGPAQDGRALGVRQRGPVPLRGDGGRGGPPARRRGRDTDRAQLGARRGLEHRRGAGTAARPGAPNEDLPEPLAGVQQSHGDSFVELHFVELCGPRNRSDPNLGRLAEDDYCPGPGGRQPRAPPDDAGALAEPDRRRRNPVAGQRAVAT